MQPLAPPAAPSFREALAFWLRLGFVSFGGPAGQIAIMHTFLVDRKRWISDRKFLHALNYCMLLPGPEAQQLATYIGWMLHGVRGGLVAGILFVLPSAVILWGLSALYVTYGTLEIVQAVFVFLKPAVVAIVAGAIVKIGKKSLQTPVHYAVAIAAFIAIYAGNIPFPLIILVAVLLGTVVYFRTKSTQKTQKNAVTEADSTENAYLINSQTIVDGAGFSTTRLLRQVLVAAVLWAAPLVVFAMTAGDFAFWKKLCLFFTQAALVTFGGAYAVLPYVAQVSVEKFGWLSQLEMIDGLALGETTPGPLIIVLAFVGFMAGYHTFGASLGAATLALAATVYYTFLPSFLFIFAGAPLIERTQANPAVKSVLQYATAAVVGVMLSLCLYLGQAVIAPDLPEIRWLPLVWAAISLAALQIFKVNLVVWIGVSAGVGVVWQVVYPS
ncbi:MAG TPA: chromate efflux transporter [Saprospiraceae bacterium]|nr:chromate efflux transporter [Saprospiraceae bacterium]HPI08946.1 chromate efflux transporter [Saprospiraceae bacterium]